MIVGICFWTLGKRNSSSSNSTINATNYSWQVVGEQTYRTWRSPQEGMKSLWSKDQLPVVSKIRYEHWTILTKNEILPNKILQNCNSNHSRMLTIEIWAIFKDWKSPNLKIQNDKKLEHCMTFLYDFKTFWHFCYFEFSYYHFLIYHSDLEMVGVRAGGQTKCKIITVQ